MSARACADELEQEILRVGAEKVAAFIFEPVVGAAGGACPRRRAMPDAVREICDRHGVLMIADEVMCGAGRCGTWRALEHDGVVPDIMSIAKGLAGGYLPLGAAVYHRKVAEPIIAVPWRPDDRPHLHRPHRLLRRRRRGPEDRRARRAGRARAAPTSRKLKKMIAEALQGVEAVGDIRGRGYFIGTELVADRETKKPFAADAELFCASASSALTTA